MNKKAVVHLWGGIGNQLFIYSFGEYLRHRYGLDVYYDLSSYGTTDIRNLELNAITDRIPEYKTGKFFFTRHTGVVRKLSQATFKMRPSVYYTIDKFNESVLTKGYKLFYFDGYWQDRKYADWLRENKADIYTPCLPLPESIKNYISQFEGKNTVSIHIRRGDYLQPQNAHLNVCTTEYYLKAIEQFSGESDIPFVIFSDDLDWVKENLHFENAIYVESGDVSPYWDLYLMSKCSNHIISNSTFSWWGAFLNPRKNKRVVAPARWRNDRKNPTLYYSEWELIEVK